MRFMLEYPLDSDADGGAFLDPANIVRFARAAEAADIDGFALTDHPAPSTKWLTHGGHETIDPFVGLGFAAAVTERIRLMTYLTVLPYRNPFLSAKSMTAVDILSGGRSTFVLGTGYLRSEFSALGVDFDERNALFDEAAAVMRDLWTTGEVRHEGRHFSALGVTLKPAAVQKPHPPLWLGGNANVVLRRVAEWGDGWAPLLGSAGLSATARSPFIASDEDLAARISEIKDRAAANGRDADRLDVLARSVDLPDDASTEQHVDALGRLGTIGVTWHRVSIDHGSFARALEEIERYGKEVVRAVRTA